MNINVLVEDTDTSKGQRIVENDETYYVNDMIIKHKRKVNDGIVKWKKSKEF